MSDEPLTDPTEDLRQQLRTAMAKEVMSPAVRKRKLLMWCVRQFLLCAIAWYFWDRPWMRWVFAIGVSLAVVHLLMILVMPGILARKAARAEQAIDRLDEVLKSEGTDPQV